MISREELQEVKDRVESRKYLHVFMNIWGGGCIYTSKDDNQRILDLLEAAERYAREDALKEVDDRLMPEGMAWPRFEDGERLHLGDFVQFEDRRFKADSVTFGIDKTVMIKDWVADRGGVWRNESWLRVNRLKPSDTWENLEVDAGKLSCDYWNCPNGSCEACRTLIEGKKPRDFYCVSNCTKAQKHDIVARAKRLAESGE